MQQRQKQASDYLFPVLLTLSLFLAASLSAQSFRGSIRGKVVDPSGAAIAGAKVTAKNIGTGLQREAATGADGGYVLAELPAGEYTVAAETAGLSPAAQMWWSMSASTPPPTST